MLIRELVGGDPPYTCKLVFLDDSDRFGHRVVDEGRVVEHVFTKQNLFEEALAEKIAEGFAETEHSLTRRVFVFEDRFWIVALDGDTVRTQFGRIQVDVRKSGQVRDREFRDRDRAVAGYHRAIAEKQEEGYDEPNARPVLIADMPIAGKKPGKRKSR